VVEAGSASEPSWTFQNQFDDSFVEVINVPYWVHPVGVENVVEPLAHTSSNIKSPVCVNGGITVVNVVPDANAANAPACRNLADPASPVDRIANENMNRSQVFALVNDTVGVDESPAEV